MTISASRLQFLLARSDDFTARCQILMCQIALQVMAEATNTVGHAMRVNYARSVLNNPGSAATSAAITLAQSTNVTNTITMEDEGPRTSVTDAALANQVATLWSALAGVDTGA